MAIIALMQSPFRLSLAAAWIFVASFLLAAAWPLLSDAEMPLAGLRHPSMGDRLLPVLQAAIVLAAAVFVSVRRWQTRDRWLIFRGIAMTLMLLGFGFIGGPFGLAIASFLRDAVQATRGEVAPAS